MGQIGVYPHVFGANPVLVNRTNPLHDGDFGRSSKKDVDGGLCLPADFSAVV